MVSIHHAPRAVDMTVRRAAPCHFGVEVAVREVDAREVGGGGRTGDRGRWGEESLGGVALRPGLAG